MDTITHGIAGALIAKAFFTDVGQASRPVHSNESLGQTRVQHAAPVQEEERERPAVSSRLAIWASTLGALFPDSDSIFDAFDSTGMSVLTEHRGITHSLLLLPLWALLLAAATRWFLRRRNLGAQGLKPLTKEEAGGGVETPPYQNISLARLAVIWGVGIASHIVLDLLNSWGTMIWMPLDRTRVVWDLAFVIDFTLTAIVLVPQLAAWAYRSREGSVPRRMMAWMLVSLGAVGVERLARITGFAFSPWVVAVVFVLGAMLFMVPLRGHLGFEVSRRAWCRAGVLTLAAYVALCAAAHQVALERVRQFAHHRQLRVENLAAIPLPPSLFRWGGLVRTPEGVYEARFRLLDRNPAFFKFTADSAENAYTLAARGDERAMDFLWFARFPSMSYSHAGATHTVEFRDLRFFPRPGRPNPFTFRVMLDEEARVIDSGWVE